MDAKAKPDQEAIARELYIATQLTGKEIAQMLAIRETTISNWVTKGGWKELRTARKNSLTKVITGMYQELAAYEALKASREVPLLTTAEMDARLKLMKTIKEMDRTAGLDQIIEVAQNLGTYLTRYAPDLAREAADHIWGFVQAEARRIVTSPSNS